MQVRLYDSIKMEFRDHWDAEPFGLCYCGCGMPTNQHFKSGHDSRFAAKLLGLLRGNPKVQAVIDELRQTSIDLAAMADGVEVEE